MKTLAIIGQKGGSGKTTTAVGIAIEAVAAGKIVAVLDLDPQATAASWGDRREATEGLSVVSCQPSRLSNVLAAAKKSGADLVIIDTPAKSSEAAISAAKSADLVILPVQPHVFDLETVGGLGELLAVAGNPKRAALITRAPVRGQRADEAREILTGMGFAVVPVVLYQRTAHADAANVGQTAREFEPGGKAALEMESLYGYIATGL